MCVFVSLKFGHFSIVNLLLWRIRKHLVLFLWKWKLTLKRLKHFASHSKPNLLMQPFKHETKIFTPACLFKQVSPFQNILSIIFLRFIHFSFNSSSIKDKCLPLSPLKMRHLKKKKLIFTLTLTGHSHNTIYFPFHFDWTKLSCLPLRAAVAN